MQRDKRKARLASARLYSNGYLRLSSDLVPPDVRQKDLKFILTPLPQEKKLELRMVENGTGDYMAKRKALYSNAHAKCPLVCAIAVLRFMGIRLPKKSVEFPVKREKNILTVQF